MDYVMNGQVVYTICIKISKYDIIGRASNMHMT